MSLPLLLSFLLLFASLSVATDDNTIKIGILHSLTGSLGPSETTLKDVVLALIKETNDAGGVLGKTLVPVVKDPGSCWPCFANEARELLTNDQVKVVFGCWTSISRKFVLPVFEELNGLLWYPVQYEGEECSRNIFYTGAAPNQQAIPAVDYLHGSLNKTKFVLLGTDYVYPRTTNNILDSYLRNALSIPSQDILTIYTPFGHSDFDTIIDEVKEFAGTEGKTAIVSTINGDANVYFYRTLAEKQISASEIPVVAFSVGEGELDPLPSSVLALLKDHLAAWNYFQSVNNTLNHEFVKKFQNFVGDSSRVFNDPMEAHYIGFNMWKQAVEQSGSFEVDVVRQALYGQKVRSLSGYDVRMNTNHHLSKPIMIGKIKGDSQFDIVYQTDPVPGAAWSPYINTPLPTADWTFPWVCGKCFTPSYNVTV
uniref:Urea ABC transporter substrate-binding protein n=1 Tax=Percolomonas cosmopolitus TaxID=63605 RepID=A0A7S1KLI2_9EUKA